MPADQKFAVTLLRSEVLALRHRTEQWLAGAEAARQQLQAAERDLSKAERELVDSIVPPAWTGERS